MNRKLAAVLAASGAIILPGIAEEFQPASLPSANPAWLEKFTEAQKPDKEGVILPRGWKVEGLKFRVPPTRCSIAKSDSDCPVLRITCEKSTGGILCDPKEFPKIDLKKTPVMRWRWRVVKYPNGADGRIKEKDDQPVAIYIGLDGKLTKRSLAYRWEGLTPVGYEGTAKYGGGLVQVNYIVVRNEETPAGEWRTESRNIAKDLKRVYGEVPEEFAISIIGNSQYTQSDSVAEIAFIEFQPEK